MLRKVIHPNFPIVWLGQKVAQEPFCFVGKARVLKPCVVYYRVALLLFSGADYHGSNSFVVSVIRV